MGDCKGTWHYTATVSQTLVTALRRMRDSQKKDSPSGKKADLKELNEKLKEMGIMEDVFRVKFKNMRSF